MPVMNEGDVVVMQFVERDLWNVNSDLDALKFDIRGSDDLAPFDCASRSADVP
jgi:hypothetical protein